MRDVVIVCINLLSRVERRRRIITLYSELKAKHRSIFNLHLSLLEACDGVSQSLTELNQRYGVRAYAAWALDPETNWKKRSLHRGKAAKVAAELPARCLT